MNDNTKMTIIKFAQKKLGRDDLDLRVELTEYKRPYLVLTVDCKKMDKNSGEFDKSYFDFVTNAHKEKKEGLYLDFKSNVLSQIVNDFEKFMGVRIETWFSYKNYDYLDDIESRIESAVKQSTYPDIEIGFRGNGNDPRISLTFYNVPADFMSDYNTGEKPHEKYIQELNQLTGLDLNQYNVGRTMGDKK